MKLSQKITSICLVLFSILMMTFSFTDTTEKVYHTKQDMNAIMHHVEEMSKKPHSIIQTEAHDEVIAYIVNVLDTMNIDNEDTTAKIAYQKQLFLATDSHDEATNLTNIIVSIPSTSANKTNNAIMFMAHYDSVAMGTGASDDLVSVAVMLETIKYYKDKIANGYEMTNDVIFAFVDGEEFGLYGSEFFVKSFTGFDNVVNRIKFAVNLESRGTSGTLIMFETSKQNYNAVQMFVSVNKNVFTSSIANMVYQSMPNGTDYSNLKDLYQGLNFANLGGGSNYHSQNDRYANVSKVYTSQQAIIVDGLISKLANYDLSTLDKTAQDGIFFSYLNITTVIYTNTAAIIFGILTIIALIACIILNIINKKKHLMKTLKGYLVSLGGIVGSAIMTFILYYVYQLVAVLFGVIDVHMLGTITYSSTAIIIGIMLTTLATCIITSKLLMKILKIDGLDVKRSMAYTLSFLGIVLTFALPVTSYLLIFTGLFLLIIELLDILLPKAKIAKYHLEVAVFALSLPLIVPVIDLASSALGLTMCYAFGALFAIEFMYIVPTLVEKVRFLTIAKVLNLCKKDKSKKDHKELVHHGAIGIFIFSQIFLFFSACFPGHISMNLQGKQNIRRLPYDDALVFVANDLGSDNYDVNYRVYDLNSYPQMKKVLPSGYKWNKTEKAYEKTMGTNQLSFADTYSVAGNTMNITRLTTDSYVYLTVKSGSNITSIDVSAEGKSFTFQMNENSSTEMLFFNDATLTLNTINDVAPVADLKYLELIENYEPLKQYDDFKALEKNSFFKYNLWLVREFSL